MYVMVTYNSRHNGQENDMEKPIPAEDRDHIRRLHQWAAQAAARGDMESSERLQRGAHTVFERALARVE